MRRARSSASATPRVIWSAVASGSGPSRRIRSRSVSPSTNSITTYGKPFDSPASSARTMFGWSRLASIAASAFNRSTCVRSFARSWRRILIATVRFSPVWTAR